MFLLIHYNIEELIIDKKNFIITPYYYVKNNNNLSISFYEQNYENNISNLVEINCRTNIKYIMINKNTFALESLKKNYFCNKSKCFLNISFDRNYLFFNFNNDFNDRVKFKCDWKFLKIKFLVKNFIKALKISNIQISNNIKDNLEYLNPLIFVNLKQESLDSDKFKNKFNVYYGGQNGTVGYIDTRLWSNYNNKLNGVDWIINNNNQHIKLDNKFIFNVSDKLSNAFSIYINFDIVYKFLTKDINKIEDRRMPIYSVYSQNLKTLFFNIAVNILINKKNNLLYLIFYEQKKKSNIYSIIIDLNKNNLEQLKKNGIGLKYLIITYIKRHSFKFRVGFKNNSIFYKKSIFKPLNINIGSHLNVEFKNFNHFIGNYIFNKKQKHKNYYDQFILCYLIINEYSLFSGSDFNKIEKTNNGVNLIWEGNNKLIINNNHNLDRRFSLSNKNKIINCLTNNCILCNENELCLYCKNDYFLDKNKNCKYNYNKNYFVNEYNELINISIEYKDNMFKILKDSKTIAITKNIIEFLNNKKNIFLNLKYDGEWISFNELNIDFAGLINKIFIKKEKNIFFNFNNVWSTNNFLNINFKKLISNKITVLIGYKEFHNNYNEDSLINKKISCNNINLKSSFFEYSHDTKFKKCYTYIKNGYYLTNNELIKCPNNCYKCSYDTINKKNVCDSCLKGFKLINNYCFFDNNFECYKNKLTDIFDNNNDDKINICDDFCNICNKKNGLICYIRNFNFNFCDKNNIVVLKSINNKTNLKNIVNLDLNNNIISKCIKGYFINENGFCEKCNNKCINCTNSLSCNICKNGYFLKYNKCISCNLKFKNCSICSKYKCIVYKFIENIKIRNCKLYKDNKCIKCENSFKLINNKCSCNLKFNFYLNKLNKCYDCNSCKFCIIDGKSNCSICNKCKNLVKFNMKQNKNEVILFYDSKNIQINESPMLFEVYNTKNYIILFRFNEIIIRFFDKDLNNTQLLIKKEIIKNLKNGYFKSQILNISSYSLKPKNSENFSKNSKNSKKLNKNIKYKFVSQKLLNYNFKVTIKYTSNFILNSSFLRVFTPIIVILNISSLLILWDINYSKSFLDFMDIIKKNHLFYIDNSIFINNSEFRKSYEKIKLKYNNNRIIGDIYFLDLDTILMLIMLLIYSFVKLIKNKERKKNIIINFFIRYSIYLKWFYFNIIQSSLIKIIYKIIFFSEIFFELNSYFNKWIIFLWINLNIWIIAHFLFSNYFYCSLFLNSKFNYKSNYKEEKIIKLFVQYKKKETRNYNLLMNCLDLVIVFIFMLLKNYFIFCISVWIIVCLLKLIYVISINNKDMKISLIFKIVSFIIWFNFFTFILIQYYFKLKSDITNLLIIWFLIINLLEISKLISYFIIKYYIKYWKNKKIYLINLYKHSALANFKFSKKKFIVT